MDFPTPLAVALAASLPNKKHGWVVTGLSEMGLPDITTMTGVDPITGAGASTTIPGGSTRMYALFSEALDLSLSVRAKLDTDREIESLDLYIDGGTWASVHAGLIAAIAALPLTLLTDREAAILAKLKS